jgi:hypothetical protein
MSEILVIGHRNPDTDSICAAIAYADFKHRIGLRDVVAARCGEVNERTQFVLRTFNVPAPHFVADVSPKVRDVMQANVISVPPRTTAVEALAAGYARLDAIASRMASPERRRRFWSRRLPNDRIRELALAWGVITA